MKYFLDTNVIIDGIKGRNNNIIKHYMENYAENLFVPAIVVAELEFGALHSNDYKKNKKLYEKFISNFAVIPFYKEYSKEYAQIRQSLESEGTPIGANDMLIAATALANDAILVTHNVGEFERIHNLRIEDWTK